MTLWDGTRWVPEADVRPTPPASRWGNAIANVLPVLMAIALVLPFTTISASTGLPGLSLSPASGAAGTAVTVRGSSLPIRTKLQLTWDGTTAGLPRVTTGGQGTFQVQITIPKSALGNHVVAVVTVATSGGKTAKLGPVSGVVTNATFDVTKPATPSPTPVPTATPKPTAAPTATPTPAPTATPTPPPTATATAAATSTPTPAPTATDTATPTPAPTKTPSPTSTAPSPTPVPISTPTPAPTSTATPAPTWTISGPITVTADNVTIDGVSISSASQTGSGITAIGTLANPIDHLTIRNCRISGFKLGIYLRFVSNLVIDNCSINGADYAGIAVFSGAYGQITNNTITNIGTTRTDFSDPAFANNAYGVMLNRQESSSTVTDPATHDFLVDSNTVDNVPLWMCFNTHAGTNITFSNNHASRCPRAFFVAGSPMPSGSLTLAHPAGIRIDNNTATNAITKPGGTTNVIAVLTAGIQGGSIDGNDLSRTFTSSIYDYSGEGNGPSVGLTETGNVLIP